MLFSPTWLVLALMWNLQDYHRLAKTIRYRIFSPLRIVVRPQTSQEEMQV